MMALENFEQVLAAAQAGSSLHPAWKKFVNTRFFVAVLAPADAEAEAEAGAAPVLCLPGGAQPVRIAETRERIDAVDGGVLLALAGADLVRLVPDGVGVAVVLSAHTFDIAASRIAWIRNSIDATLAKATQAREAAVAAAGSTPAPAPAVAVPPPAAPEKHAPVALPWPARRPESAGAYEDLVFMEEEPPPAAPTAGYSDRSGRIDRRRALAYGLPLLAGLGLAGKVLLGGESGPAQSALALDAGGSDAAGPAGPAGAGRTAGGPLASAVWTSPDGGLTIEFPAHPEEDAVRAHLRERLGALRMRQFSALAHSENYKVQVLDLGTAPADPEATMLALQASLLARDAVLTVPPMELIFKGYPGRDIKAGQRLIRMAVVNATVYIATADAADDAASMRRAGEFIGSLALNQ